MEKRFTKTGVKAFQLLKHVGLIGLATNADNELNIKDAEDYIIEMADSIRKQRNIQSSKLNETIVSGVSKCDDGYHELMSNMYPGTKYCSDCGTKLQ